jgi:hypothetical protein
MNPMQKYGRHSRQEDIRRLCFIMLGLLFNICEYRTTDIRGNDIVELILFISNDIVLFAAPCVPPSRMVFEEI